MIEPQDDLGNALQSFDRLTAINQEQLRTWVRVTLEPTKHIGDGPWAHSYALKHAAEKALGWYVSNGELKGAMLAEGYRWKQCDGTPRNPNPNWLFNSRARLHSRGNASAGILQG